jgi:glycosyltransferase involved in cell wall biosynthesis
LIALISGAHPRGSAANEAVTMLAAHGVTNEVELVHGIGDMRDLYSKLDLLLIPFRGTRGPSDYPMVLLEALTCGVPAVCTPVGAIPEVVQDGVNGFLSKELTAESYADALNRAVVRIASCGPTISAHARISAEQFRASRIGAQTLTYLGSLVMMDRQEHRATK